MLDDYAAASCCRCRADADMLDYAAYASAATIITSATFTIFSTGFMPLRYCFSLPRHLRCAMLLFDMPRQPLRHARVDVAR